VIEFGIQSWKERKFCAQEVCFLFIKKNNKNPKINFDQESKQNKDYGTIWKPIPYQDPFTIQGHDEENHGRKVQIQKDTVATKTLQKITTMEMSRANSWLL